MTENTAVPDTVSEARFVDAAGGIVSVAVWDKANLLFDSMDIGAGVLGLSQVSDDVVLSVPKRREQHKAKRWQERFTLRFKAKRREEHKAQRRQERSTLRFKVKRRQQRISQLFKAKRREA